MTTNHIDTLDKWWENAEEGAARKGDTIIVRYDGDGEYGIRISDADLISHVNDIRILRRAPKPKPAWHDAVAVIASTDRNGPQVWQRCGGHWDGTAGDEATAEDLRDVTPLIEAKVTDAARDRVWDELVHHGLIDPQKHRPSQGWTADVVHVALGLETA